MGGSAGPGDRRGRPGPGRLPAGTSYRPRAGERRRTAGPTQHAVRQHHPSRGRSALSGRPRDGAPHQEPDSLECHGHGGAPEQVRRRYRRPHLHLCLARHAAGSRLQPFLPRQLRRPARRPDLFPGPRLARRLRARVSRRPPDRGAPQEFPPRTARAPGPLLVSAPLADAGFLELPDRLHGPRSDQRDLPGALHAVPGESRHHPAPRRATSGRSWAMAKWTSPNRWAPSRWPRARSSTT